jgi:hypothetical protein
MNVVKSLIQIYAPACQISSGKKLVIIPLDDIFLWNNSERFIREELNETHALLSTICLRERFKSIGIKWSSLLPTTCLPFVITDRLFSRYALLKIEVPKWCYGILSPLWHLCSTFYSTLPISKKSGNTWSSCRSIFIGDSLFPHHNFSTKFKLRPSVILE